MRDTAIVFGISVGKRDLKTVQKLKKRLEECGFMPAHLFGLTVSAELGAAFIFAIILQSRKD